MFTGNTRDEIHAALLADVRFGRADADFMVAMLVNYIDQNRALSYNQNALYEKIIVKHQRQIKKLGSSHTFILGLPWKNGVIPTSVLKTYDYFRLVQKNNRIEMQLYFSFNTDLVNEVIAIVNEYDHYDVVRSYSVDTYDFGWCKPDNAWIGPFNLSLFRKLYKFAVKHGIQCDSAIDTFVTQLESYGSSEDWTPSLRVVHGRMYVNCISESMLPILAQSDPGDCSFRNIEKLCRLGLEPPAIEPNGKYLGNCNVVVRSTDDLVELFDFLNTHGNKTLVLEPEPTSDFNNLPSDVKNYLSSMGPVLTSTVGDGTPSPILKVSYLSTMNQIMLATRAGFDTVVVPASGDHVGVRRLRAMFDKVITITG